MHEVLSAFRREAPVGDILERAAGEGEGSGRTAKQGEQGSDGSSRPAGITSSLQLKLACQNLGFGVVNVALPRRGVLRQWARKVPGKLGFVRRVDASPNEAAKLLSHTKRSPTYALAGDGVGLLQQAGTHRTCQHVTRPIRANIAAARVDHGRESGETAVDCNGLEDAVVLRQRASSPNVVKASCGLSDELWADLERCVARFVRNVCLGERRPPITLRVEADERALRLVQPWVLCRGRLEAPPCHAELALAGKVGRLAQLATAAAKGWQRDCGNAVVVVKVLTGVQCARILGVTCGHCCRRELAPARWEGAVRHGVNQECSTLAHVGNRARWGASRAEEDEGASQVKEPEAQATTL